MDKKPSENAEALARKLQEKLRHERPQWVRWLPLVAAIVVGAMGLLAWVLYPAPDPPPLTVTAFDALTVTGEPAAIRANLDPEKDDVKVGSRAGLPAIFWADPAGAAAENTLRHKAVTDEHGQARVMLDPGAVSVLPYQVRQTSSNKKQKSPEDRAHVHALAKDSPLLLVDAEETLADLDVKLWTKTNPLNIGVRPGAAEALRTARDQHKFAVAYLAVVNTPAKEYRRVRGWIALQAVQPTGVPDGPVLGRLRYDASSVSEARQALLDELRQRFTGPLVAVVRTSEAAEQCLAVGIRAIAMGGGDFPDQVKRIKGWDELPKALLP